MILMKTTPGKIIYDEKKIEKWKKERLKNPKRLYPYIPLLGIIGFSIIITEFTFFSILWGSIGIIASLLIEWLAYWAYKDEKQFLRIYEDRIELPHVHGFRLKKWIIPVNNIQKVKMNLKEPYERPSDHILLKNEAQVVGKILKENVYSIEDFRSAIEKIGIKVVE